MSICPSNDIHSVYIDNELPSEFIAEYEDHVKNCPKCQAEINKLKAVRDIFTADFKACTPDSHYVDESFERLKVKMAYSKNTGKVSKPEMKFKTIGYYAMAAAAVLAFAFVVPLSLNNVKKASGGAGALAATSATSSATPTSTVSYNLPSMASVQSSASEYSSRATSVSLNSGRSVVISGNIDNVVRPPRHKRGQKFSYGNSGRDMISDVEMIRPDFGDSAEISIRITIPGLDEGPIPFDFPAQVNVPVNVVAGD